MLRFLLCLFLFAKASEKLDEKYENLVQDVENNLSECFEILVEARNGYPRRSEMDRDISSMVKQQMMVCNALSDKVNVYLENVANIGKVDSKLGTISLRPSEEEFINMQLSMGHAKMGEILYIASEDGDDVAVFHEKCDEMGPTVTIIETTEGYLLGGYSDKDWSSRNEYIPSSLAFIFATRPTLSRCNIKPGHEQTAVLTNFKLGPSFGGDLTINENAMGNSHSTLSFLSYVCPTNANINGGMNFFTVKDYVVLKAVKYEKPEDSK